MKKNIIPHSYQVSIADRKKANKHNSFLLWFTGLSGSGRSRKNRIVFKIKQQTYKQYKTRFSFLTAKWANLLKLYE